MTAKEGTADTPLKALRTVRMVRLILLFALVLYFVLSMRLPSTQRSTPSKAFEIAVLLIALWGTSSVFYFNRSVRKAEGLLSDNSHDAKALKQWRVGYVAIYVVSFSVALYGMVLHFFGAPTIHIIPFFAAGAVLVLWFRPRPPFTRSDTN